MNEHDDLFETDLKNRLEKPGAKGSKKGPNLLAPAAFLIVFGIAVYFLLPVLKNGFKGGAKVSQTEAVPQMAGTEDMTRRQLTSFVEQFLMAYYNYSYTLYDESVRRAESLMTPTFQAKYSAQARNLEFKRKLDSNRVMTDGIRIMPNSFGFAQEGNRHYVKLSGVMTYTTGVNGVAGEFPINLLLAVERTESGFLVDNVERTR